MGWTYQARTLRARAKLRDARSSLRVACLVLTMAGRFLSVGFQVAFSGWRLRTPQLAVQGGDGADGVGRLVG